MGHDRPELFIAGRWKRSDSTTDVERRNPATGEVIGRVAVASNADVDEAIAGARASFDSRVWVDTDPKERAAVLDRAADLIEARSDELAELLTAELGCPLSFSKAAHIPNPIKHLRANAEYARNSHYEEKRTTGTASTIVAREPVGVVGAITPWNGPLSSPTIKVAPALGAGCSMVLKPSSETPFTVYALADALSEAGLPEGVLSIVPGGRGTGQHIVAHPEIDKVGFTGSTAVGKTIMKTCADRMARVTLQVGRHRPR
jgi:betaine-aldehyde dehydrogenase